jgi:hypothetical protein
VHELCTNDRFHSIGVSFERKSRFPKLLKTLKTKRVEGANREDSGSLQAGGHRFDPGHVHQLIPSLPITYAAFSVALFWCNFGTIGTTDGLLEAGSANP